MIKVKITVNLTKILAFLVLAASVFLSVYLKDYTPFVATVPSLAVILAVRDYSEKNQNNAKI